MHRRFISITKVYQFDSFLFTNTLIELLKDSLRFMVTPDSSMYTPVCCSKIHLPACFITSLYMKSWKYSLKALDHISEDLLNSNVKSASVLQFKSVPVKSLYALQSSDFEP